MRAFVSILLAALVTLSGCSTATLNKQEEVRNAVHVRIDSTFGEYGTARIISGLALWHKATGINIIPEVVNVQDDEIFTFLYDNEITIYNANVGFPAMVWDKVIEDEPGRDRVLAFTIVKTGDVFILDTSRLFKVFVHEFGHTLGCGHSDNKWDIMYPKIGNNLTAISKECTNIARKKFEEFL